MTASYVTPELLQILTGLLDSAQQELLAARGGQMKIMRHKGGGSYSDATAEGMQHILQRVSAAERAVHLIQAT